MRIANYEGRLAVVTGDPPDGHTDWEVELVAVIGRRAHRVPRSAALA